MEYPDRLTDTQPSVRLIRAALAEREGLERQRERLQAVRSKVLAELRRIDDAMSTLAQREMLLERLAPPAPDSNQPAKLPPSVASVPGAFSSASVDERRSMPTAGRPAAPVIEVLRGPSIRRVAVAILLDRGMGALHYREWFQMLGDEGYAVEGKDPLAVFLTQISRSPVVGKSTQSGVYELDMEAPQRLRRRIAQLHGELREFTTPSADGDLVSDARPPQRDHRRDRPRRTRPGGGRVAARGWPVSPCVCGRRSASTSKLMLPDRRGSHRAQRRSLFLNRLVAGLWTSHREP